VVSFLKSAGEPAIAAVANSAKRSFILRVLEPALISRRACRRSSCRPSWGPRTQVFGVTDETEPTSLNTNIRVSTNRVKCTSDSDLSTCPAESR
jgi:hypothetical protein